MGTIGDGQFDLDALNRMQSLGMVINESMRLLAPVLRHFEKPWRTHAFRDTSPGGGSKFDGDVGLSHRGHLGKKELWANRCSHRLL